MGITIERSNHTRVATVIIDYPEKRNAIDRSAALKLADAFRALDKDDKIAAVVLFGSGGTFCAGADLKEFARGAGNRIEIDGDGPMGPTRMLFAKPTIAAISGYAVAGGLELALWCDLRVVEEDSTLGVFCRRIGVPLIDGGTIRLPRLIGLSRALDMILTGRPVDASEALAIGLANRVVTTGHARTEAETLAATIAGFPQAALHSDRRSAYEQHSMSLLDALANELRHGQTALEEAQLGATRFSRGAGRHGKPL